MLPVSAHVPEAVGQAPDTSMGTPCEDAGPVSDADEAAPRTVETVR